MHLFGTQFSLYSKGRTCAFLLMIFLQGRCIYSVAFDRAMPCLLCYTYYVLKSWLALSEKFRASPEIEGFLLPGSAGSQFRVSQCAKDTTIFVKDERSLLGLFRTISLYERRSRAKLNKGKTIVKAMWLGQWRYRVEEPLGLTWVKKMKL